MKILFYSHTGQVSGAENILLLALRRLNRKRFTLAAACPRGALTEKIEELGIPCAAIAELNARFTWRVDRLGQYLYSFVRTIKQLRNEIKNAAPDLIHANSIRAGLAATGASIGMKIPVYWHLQDELPRHPISTAIRLFVLFSPRTRLIAASRATLESFRGKLLRRFGKNIPQRVVLNGVELEKFHVEPETRGKIRAELGLSDAEFVVGMVGQITPRKGQLEALENFAALRARHPDATLLIAGAPMFNRDHEYLAALKETVNRLGLEEKVKFLGLRRDVAALMQAFDVLLVNSKSEAFVVVAIEAMVCGTPVIATDVGGTREMIEHKTNGWLVPFGDADRLQAALVECARNPVSRRQLAEAGKVFAVSHLNAEKFIADLEAYFGHETRVKKAEGNLRMVEN